MNALALPIGWALTVGGPAATESPAQPPTVNSSSWDGFGVESADGRHAAQLGFLGQMRAVAEDTSDTNPTGGASLVLVRPIVGASLWNRRIQMRVMPEFAGPRPELLDATTTLAFHDAAQLTLGQFRPWLSRGFRTGLHVVGVPGRGAVVDRFRVDRDVGATLRGTVWNGHFDYAVGVLNGGGRGSTTFSPSPLLTGRMVVTPLGPVPYSQIPYVQEHGLRVGGPGAPENALAVAIGASAYTVATREEVALAPTLTRRTEPLRRWGASADVVVSRGRVFGLIEGFYEHRAGSSDVGTPMRQAWGAYGQVGVLVWNPFVDVVVRAGTLTDGDDVVLSLEPGVGAYLLGNHGKLQLSYRHDAALEPWADARHLGTLQAQLQF